MTPSQIKSQEREIARNISRTDCVRVELKRQYREALARASAGGQRSSP